MANVTVTLDDDLLARAREEADRAGKSLSRYLADLIAAEDERMRKENVAAMEHFLSLAEHVPLNRPEWKFDRDEIYDRPYPGGHERRFVQPRSGERGEEDSVRGVAERSNENQFDGGQPASVQRNKKRGRKKT